MNVALGRIQITAYNHQLALAAARNLGYQWESAEVVEITPTDNDHNQRALASDVVTNMVLIELPSAVQQYDGEKPCGTSAHAKYIQDRLYFEFSVEVPVKCIEGLLYVRISAHIYNYFEQYVHILGPAILSIALSNELD